MMFEFAHHNAREPTRRASRFLLNSLNLETSWEVAGTREKTHPYETTENACAKSRTVAGQPVSKGSRL